MTRYTHAEHIHTWLYWEHCTFWTMIFFLFLSEHCIFSLLRTSKVQVLLLHLADADTGVPESVSLTLLWSWPVFHPRFLADDIHVPEDTGQWGLLDLDVSGSLSGCENGDGNDARNNGQTSCCLCICIALVWQTCADCCNGVHALGVILTFVHLYVCLLTSPLRGNFCRCAGPTPRRIVCNSGRCAFFQGEPRQWSLWFTRRTQKGSECWKTTICEEQSSHMFSDDNKQINSCDKGEEQGFWIIQSWKDPHLPWWHSQSSLRRHPWSVHLWHPPLSLCILRTNKQQSCSDPVPLPTRPRKRARAHVQPSQAPTHCNRSCL